MTPFFDNWHAFWSMGGYGFYVWLCYGISIIGIIALIVTSVIAHQRLLRTALQYHQRQDIIAQQKNALPQEWHNES